MGLNILIPTPLFFPTHCENLGRPCHIKANKNHSSATEDFKCQDLLLAMKLVLQRTAFTMIIHPLWKSFRKTMKSREKSPINQILKGGRENSGLAISK